MTQRRPVKKCVASQVTCPNPLCSQPQQANTPRGRFRGRGLHTCTYCGVEYFYHAADGGAEVIGLWPGESDTIDIDAPLPVIWERLGLLAVA